jgi:putative toxin-antitoxin system antitoxin component (TIGR02293 family)
MAASKKNTAVLYKPPPKAGASARSRGSLGLSLDDIFDVIDQLAGGLPFAKLSHFLDSSGLTPAEVAQVLRIPPRTLARRKAHGDLTSQESESLLRLAEIFDKTVELFEGDVRAARLWLRSPCKALGDREPLALSQSELGARAVEDLIGRLEFGVFS